MITACVVYAIQCIALVQVIQCIASAHVIQCVVLAHVIQCIALQCAAWHTLTPLKKKACTVWHTTPHNKYNVCVLEAHGNPHGTVGSVHDRKKMLRG